MRPKTKRLFVSQALDGFLFARGAEGRSPRALQDYAYCISMLTDWLEANGRGDILVADLSTNDLRRFFVFLRQRQPTLSAKTVRNVHMALSSLWSWLGAEFGPSHKAHQSTEG